MVRCRMLRKLSLVAAVTTCLLAQAAFGGTTTRPAATVPISLASSLNATCTAPAGGQTWLLTGCTAGRGTSFVAESMPAAGRFDVRGITFLWPGQSDFYGQLPGAPTGTLRLDSIVDAAKPIDLGGRTGYRYVALLVAGLGDQFNVPYTV